MTMQERASYMWACIERNRGALVSWYLMLSWLYYMQDITVVHDDDFDKVCRRLKAEWPLVKHHHKRRVSLELLDAGSGFNLKNYPKIVIGAASRLAIEDGHVRWNEAERAWT
ncbi:hypothetical protein [Mesorhizobium sp. M0767]|uniref:DNA ligase LigA-related protein n=1 Tax=Mesorhizobium sp. M0767 TaxID=2956995 RepID=UPI00333AD4CE